MSVNRDSEVSMKQEEHVKSAGEHREKSWRVLIVENFLLTFAGIASAVLVNFISTSWKSTGPDAIPRLSLFLVGLLLLAMIIVSIASFMRRKNREVILLKQRLAEIYLSALRKSALNPRLHSSISHE